MERKKIIADLCWIYSALTKGVIIENNEAVIQAIPAAIALLKEDEGLDVLRKALSDEIHETAKQFRR